MADAQTDMGAYHEGHLEELASRPNTTVYKAVHDTHRDPWPVARLRPVLSRLVERVLGFPTDTSTFTIQKTCLDDPEVLDFYRGHNKMYTMLTDPALMRDQKSRTTIMAMLDVRARVESGEVVGEDEANALATRQIATALGASWQPPPQGAPAPQ